MQIDPEVLDILNEKVDDIRGQEPYKGFNQDMLDLSVIIQRIQSHTEAERVDIERQISEIDSLIPITNDQYTDAQYNIVLRSKNGTTNTRLSYSRMLHSLENAIRKFAKDNEEAFKDLLEFMESNKIYTTKTTQDHLNLMVRSNTGVKGINQIPK